MNKHLIAACDAFLLALNDSENMEHADLFPVLSERAEKWGRILTAEQKGIQGTYIRFKKINEA